MNRRAFLTSSAATGSVVAVSGCLGILGNGDDTGPAEGVRHDESNSPVNSAAYRIGFVDRAGTLGQVAQPQTVEDDYNTIVNEYEGDWQAMDDNDWEVVTSSNCVLLPGRRRHGMNGR